MSGNLPPEVSLPPGLQEQFYRFSRYEQMLNIARDARRKAEEITDSLVVKGHFEPWQLPEPWYFIVTTVGTHTNLPLEVLEKPAPLKPYIWTPANASESLGKYIKRTRKYPYYKVFVSDYREVDHEDPYKVSMFYSDDRRARVPLLGGLRLALHTTAEIEEFYTQ